MEKFMFLAIHYGIPLLAIVKIIWFKPKSKTGALSGFLFWGGLLGFVYLWGQYPMVGGYYFRYLPLLIFLWLLVVSIKNIRHTSRIKPKLWWPAISTVLGILLAIPILYLSGLLILGRSYPEPRVNLQFPLKNGRYYIASGGSNKAINNHVRVQPNPQQYALDINKLGSMGRVAEGVLAGENDRHFIFGEPVYAPCKGEVIAVKNDVPDNAGASMDVGPEDGTGNFVELRCGDIFIFMPHLKYGSVQVKEGMRVDTATVLGQVGNSGYSQEPHLHFQASKTDKNDKKAGIPIQFNSKLYFRNDIVDN